MDIFQKMVRQSIVNHPTFFCPISKQCLDAADAILVEAWARDPLIGSHGIMGPYSVNGIREMRTPTQSKEEAIKGIVYRMIHHNENIGQVSIYRGWAKSTIYELSADNEVIEA
jgi:hypothetical protein